MQTAQEPVAADRQRHVAQGLYWLAIVIVLAGLLYALACALARRGAELRVQAIAERAQAAQEPLSLAEAYGNPPEPVDDALELLRMHLKSLAAIGGVEPECGPWLDAACAAEPELDAALCGLEGQARSQRVGQWLNAQLYGHATPLSEPVHDHLLQSFLDAHAPLLADVQAACERPGFWDRGVVAGSRHEWTMLNTRGLSNLLCWSSLARTRAGRDDAVDELVRLVQFLELFGRQPGVIPLLTRCGVWWVLDEATARALAGPNPSPGWIDLDRALARLDIPGFALDCLRADGAFASECIRDGRWRLWGGTVPAVAPSTWRELFEWPEVPIRLADRLEQEADDRVLARRALHELRGGLRGPLSFAAGWPSPRESAFFAPVSRMIVDQALTELAHVRVLRAALRAMLDGPDAVRAFLEHEPNPFTGGCIEVLVDEAGGVRVHCPRSERGASAVLPARGDIVWSSSTPVARRP